MSTTGYLPTPPAIGAGIPMTKPMFICAKCQTTFARYPGMPVIARGVGRCKEHQSKGTPK